MATVKQLLEGRGAYARIPHILEDLTLDLVSERVAGAPHSIHEELWHVVYWQRHLLEIMRGGTPEDPEHASAGWPDEPAPADEHAWRALLDEFARGLDEARAHAEQTERFGERVHARYTLGEALESLAVHNAYHFGRIVLLRQQRGAWPPPSGGDTW